MIKLSLSDMKLSVFCKYIPTYAKRTQYTAAIIGNGIAAITAPNLPDL
jgi:hypothetical protein